MSKFSIYDELIRKLIESEPDITTQELTQRVLNTRQSRRQNPTVRSFQKYLHRNRTRIMDDHEGIYKASDSCDVSNQDIKHLWIKNDKVSAFVKNPNYVEPTAIDYNKLRDSIIEDIQKYSPKFEPIKYPKLPDDNILIIDPADIHVGKICSSFESGEEYNSQIAVKRVRDGINGILSKSKPFGISEIVFVAGNDILHVDNAKNTTTSGTTQDVDGMWYDAFNIAKNIYITIIEKLIQVAHVRFVYNPSNHDYTSGFFLCQVIESYFRHHKSIVFDVNMAHRKYYNYGKNLFGFTHGDGAKFNDLPLLMAHECEYWSKSVHRYIFTHHVHHKHSKDIMGVCVESLRSPSGTDSWHHRNGYQHAPKAIEGFIHNANNGQVARITHIF